MPLKQGYSRRTIGSNIKAELRRGKTFRQARAIALSVARRAKKRKARRKKKA